jgi:dynein heavy chain 1
MLALPNNVRVMFEVQDLKYATLATVSRCGMIWFSEETLTTRMIFQNYLAKLRQEPLDETEREVTKTGQPTDNLPGLNCQKQIADVLQPYFLPEDREDSLVTQAMALAGTRAHIMDLTRLRVLTAMFSLLNKGITSVISYNQLHSDFPLSLDTTSKYITNRLLYSIMWGFGGSMGLADREIYSNEIKNMAASQVTVALPDTSSLSLLDYGIEVENGEWFLWKSKVPSVEIETHKVTSPDVVIPTVDTIRHEEVLHSWLAEHR